MTPIRHAIVHITDSEGDGRAIGVVVDAIDAQTDPALPDYERLIDTPSHRFIPSDEAEVGWTWTEDGGLTAP